MIAPGTTRRPLLVLLALLPLAQPVLAQGPPLTLPQASQAATVSQRIGLTDITVKYHRPAVRQRTVLGDLVPYDQVWRAGANENTVLSFSTPFSVGGQELPAGDYGLHLIPTKTEWTVILNKESTAWGSFFYDQSKDAVRFTARPQTSDFQEFLAYTFESPGPAGVTLTLHWEKVALPIAITVDTPAVVTENLQQQLHNLPGFSWQSFAQAASWTATHNGNLDRAATWADRGIAMNRNYQTLRAKALVLERKGDAPAAAAVREDALKLATEADINAYGYELLGPVRSTRPSPSSARTSRTTRRPGTPTTAWARRSLRRDRPLRPSRSIPRHCKWSATRRTRNGSTGSSQGLAVCLSRSSVRT
jgi:hypothetical protein